MRRMYSKPQLLEAIQEESKINGIELGNTTIKGVLKVEEYEYDEDIELDFGENHLSGYYAHARISNGKLNIVLGLLHTAEEESISVTLDQVFGSITLPAEILSKLYPAYSTVLSRENINILSYAENVTLSLVLLKTETGINICCGQNTTLVFDASNYVGRIEMNFIL